jgi:ferredoxin
VDPNNPQFITLRFIDWYGQETVVDKARVGESILDTAQRFWLPIPGKCDHGDGLVGDTNDFGEGASCKFCHVYIDRGFVHKLPKPLVEEDIVREYFEDFQDNSRAACQIKLTPEMDGMLIGMPSYPGGKEGEHDGGDYM